MTYPADPLDPSWKRSVRYTFYRFYVRYTFLGNFYVRYTFHRAARAWALGGLRLEYQVLICKPLPKASTRAPKDRGGGGDGSRNGHGLEGFGRGTHQTTSFFGKG